MGDLPRPRCNVSRACWPRLVLINFLFLPLASAQAPKTQPKPTELVVKRYERLILRGELLNPEGWRLTSRLFTKSQPYPENSEIQVEWTGTHALGEEWNDGTRAQVNTKWNDYYGTIDSKLRFKASEFAPLPTMESFRLIYVPRHYAAKGRQNFSNTPQGEWKIEGLLSARTASIPVSIKYLEKKHDATGDPILRKNAERSIRVLRKLQPGCGVPSPC